MEGGKVSRWWSDLGHLEGGDAVSQGWLSGAITKRVGCGNITSFWHDSWIDHVPLATTFSRLYSICESKEAMVVEIGEWRNDVWCWNFDWRRGLFVWEEELLVSLFDTLAGKALSTEVEDSWYWLGKTASPYAVKEAYPAHRFGD